MNTRDPLAIPDVQGSEDKRKLAIDQVGIKAIRHPIRVAERAGEVQHTVATCNMYVGLPHQFKGTHMSRFVEILNAHEREISVETFRLMLDEMVERLEAQSGHIEMTFPYFVNKAAPVSKVKSLMDYEVTFVGEIDKGEKCFKMKVIVPVTSLCPCSKRISDYGAHQGIRVDRGAGRLRRKARLERALRAAQAARREVRHRTRLRQPQVRRRHGARHRRGSEPRQAHRVVPGGVGEFRVDSQPLCLRTDRKRQNRQVTNGGTLRFPRWPPPQPKTGEDRC